MGVCDREGKTYPVLEILAADKAADIAIFRVKADDLAPLALGSPAEIGSGVRVISHPDRRFFMQTSGEVSRYHQQPARKNQPATVWMNITADYAKGSSGGPVIDDAGKVVGMVSSTQSIYYESNNGQPKGALQMVVKNCVPAAAIRALLK
jgi:S1-C subfamily serine protease